MLYYHDYKITQPRTTTWGDLGLSNCATTTTAVVDIMQCGSVVEHYKTIVHLCLKNLNNPKKL